MATVGGVLLSIGAAYAVTSFNNIMDALQLVFAIINAPLFATFLLGMFWKRTTGHAAFTGLVTGTLGAVLHHGLTLPLVDAGRHPLAAGSTSYTSIPATWHRTSGPLFSRSPLTWWLPSWSRW